MDKFTHAYIVCALWSSTDDKSEPLDSNYSIDDIGAETLETMEKECADFQEGNKEDLALYYAHFAEDSAGHDFWLTRNGHGAGFWDRGLNQLGDRLTRATKVYGSVDLYVGDDGKIW